MAPTGIGSLHHLPDPLARAIESAKVPALPQALLKLLRLVDDDTTIMSEMAALVERDSGLCARLLTAANSPGLRRGTELRSVAHCLAALGTRLVRSIATCLALQSMFERRHDSVQPDLTEYWRHSIRVAECAREIAVACAYPQPDEAYLGGLLHDIGELVLLSAQGSSYARMIAAVQDEESLVVLERQQLGLHHGEVGAWLVDRWECDLDIADAILFHHASASDIVTAAPLPQIVWLAHAISLAAPGDETVAAQALLLFGEEAATRMEGIDRRTLERTSQIAEAIGIVPDLSADGIPITVLPRVAIVAPRSEDGSAHSEIEALMRDAAMMQPLQRDLFGIESDAELLLSLRESARILFDLAHIAFFMRDAENDRLSAAGFGTQPPLLRRATIRCGAAHCLVATAAATRKIVSSFDSDYPQPPALIDLQFARVFGTDGLLCVPMNGRMHTVGVMVFGLSSLQHARLRKRLPWILNFGRIAALSLEAWSEAMNLRKRAEDDASARFQRQARRVIHEAGNPLGIIRSYLRILDGKLPQNAAVRDEISVLREEIERVTSIVQRMSEIPPDEGRGQRVDVATLIRDLMAFYDRPLFKARGIDTRFSLGETPDAVACDRDSLKQVLVNLWKNAAEALPEGGRIEVTVNGGVIQNGRNHVEVLIADNGPGIPTEILARLAPNGPEVHAGDRGMGLSIVGALVAAMGATIRCSTRPGAGTTFALMLPCRP